jgi:hypothetical protein
MVISLLNAEAAMNLQVRAVTTKEIKKDSVERRLWPPGVGKSCDYSLWETQHNKPPD